MENAAKLTHRAAGDAVEHYCAAFASPAGTFPDSPPTARPVTPVLDLTAPRPACPLTPVEDIAPSSDSSLSSVIISRPETSHHSPGPPATLQCYTVLNHNVSLSDLQYKLEMQDSDCIMMIKSRQII